jgi:hypothetical protein
MTRVKVKVRPGQSIRFPGVCANCLEPAGEQMRLRKRLGRLTREIDVPLCAACSEIVQRRSGEEERLERLGRVAAGAAGLVVALLLFLLIPGGLPGLRLVIAVGGGAAAGLAVLGFFTRRREAAVLPAKQVVLNAARVADFSWRATTFDFRSADFARRFRELNEARLMELEPAQA